jgi:hypothetical protein
MNEKLKEKLLSQSNNRLIQTIKNSNLPELSKYNKETIEFYCSNPGYYRNITSEKQAYLVSEPQIKYLKPIKNKNEIETSDPAKDNNGEIPPIRIIYSILGIKNSFDLNSIDKKRFESKLWTQYKSFIVQIFGLSNIENDDIESLFESDEKLEFEDVFKLVNICLNRWCGACLEEKENKYYIKNNGFDIINV